MQAYHKNSAQQALITWAANAATLPALKPQRRGRLLQALCMMPATCWKRTQLQPEAQNKWQASSWSKLTDLAMKRMVLPSCQRLRAALSWPTPACWSGAGL